MELMGSKPFSLKDWRREWDSITAILRICQWYLHLGDNTLCLSGLPPLPVFGYSFYSFPNSLHLQSKRYHQYQPRRTTIFHFVALDSATFPGFLTISEARKH
jgi:hypothetical protein